MSIWVRKTLNAAPKAGTAAVVGLLAVLLLGACSGADEPPAVGPSPSRTHVATTKADDKGMSPEEAASIAATANDDGVVTDREAAAIVKYDRDQYLANRAKLRAEQRAIELRVAKGECFSYSLGTTGEEAQTFNERLNARPGIGDTMESAKESLAVVEGLLADLSALPGGKELCSENDRTVEANYRDLLDEHAAAARERIANQGG